MKGRQTIFKSRKDYNRTELKLPQRPMFLDEPIMSARSSSQNSERHFSNRFDIRKGKIVPTPKRKQIFNFNEELKDSDSNN